MVTYRYYIQITCKHFWSIKHVPNIIVVCFSIMKFQIYFIKKSQQFVILSILVNLHFFSIPQLIYSNSQNQTHWKTCKNLLFFFWSSLLAMIGIKHCLKKIKMTDAYAYAGPFPFPCIFSVSNILIALFSFNTVSHGWGAKLTTELC